ncbi:MAG: site-specific DNA-methyltransferase [Solirubrobacteraceae bacterium]
MLYGDLHRWGLVHADALALLKQLPAGSIDAVVVDPPYWLGFKGEHWDGGNQAGGRSFQAFTAWWAEQVLRILKPGGYVAAFGAPRTVHRLVAGFEDAGLEVRDQMLWLASGVPKSRRMAGGLGSGLKPAYEPIILARKPLDRATPTIAGNVAKHTTGALNIDATRIARLDDDGQADGYWPATLALGHEADCDPPSGDCVPDCVVPLIDRIAAQERRPGTLPFSRLFYAAKASRAEREAGLENLPKLQTPIFSGTLRAPRANGHPTVKPIALMRWLVRLVVPPGGLVLDPFAGSGSTGIAAVLEGRQFVGIEAEAEYVEIARARIAYWAGRLGAEAAL